MWVETLLVCWLIACVYIPLLYALTDDTPREVALIGRSWEIVRAARLRERWLATRPEVCTYEDEASFAS